MSARAAGEVRVTPFAERLSSIVEKVGVSPADLARESGLGRSYLWRLRKGKRLPSADAVKRLAFALGVTPATLLQGTNLEGLLAASREAAGSADEIVELRRQLAEAQAGEQAARGDLAVARAELKTFEAVRARLAALEPELRAIAAMCGTTNAPPRGRRKAAGGERRRRTRP